MTSPRPRPPPHRRRHGATRSCVPFVRASTAWRTSCVTWPNLNGSRRCSGMASAHATARADDSTFTPLSEWPMRGATRCGRCAPRRACAVAPPAVRASQRRGHRHQRCTSTLGRRICGVGILACDEGCVRDTHDVRVPRTPQKVKVLARITNLECHSLLQNSTSI